MPNEDDVIDNEAWTTFFHHFKIRYQKYITNQVITLVKIKVVITKCTNITVFVFSSKSKHYILSKVILKHFCSKQ